MICAIVLLGIMAQNDMPCFQAFLEPPYLRGRGFAVNAAGEMSNEDMERGIRQSFAQDDAKLLTALLGGLSFTPICDRHADLLLRLFREHADGPFKRAIKLDMAWCLSKVRRIAQSKFGCEFYDYALQLWSTNESVGAGLFSGGCLVDIAEEVGFPARAYAVRKLLFAQPIADSKYAASACFQILEKEFDDVTPEMAYHIYERYKTSELFEKYRKAYEDKAQPLLSAAALPESASLDVLKKQVDTTIEENGRRLHEQYGNVEPGPYEPIESRDFL